MALSIEVTSARLIILKCFAGNLRSLGFQARLVLCFHIYERRIKEHTHTDTNRALACPLVQPLAG